MITLAFDSTAAVASVAVIDDGRVLGECTINNGLTQSELLLPMAEDLLKTLGLTFDSVGLYAAAAGPGSITGVRIGVSLIKGLAFGKNIPCVEVSTLEALAENLVPLNAVLCPAMDARRAQVYNAIFECDGENVKRITPDRAISLAELADELRAYGDRKIYVSGDGYTVVHRALAEVGVVLQKTPRAMISASAASVGLVAERKYAHGEFVSDSELSPIYLRLPQAERERLEKMNDSKK
ncbi:MAG: tRNA (adenosine(37)-N6)-threonylcarbamoyltransferase complex dimerization subunit type 1 TsaB [Clostridia bacterium]|nr:tRNA (adenosine(37)-N6)-threonylcarbamoyltransferase complex dimerization subunit type 1 TsaB [Clostridia bacterium]